jgi:hypothetical protein
MAAGRYSFRRCAACLSYKEKNIDDFICQKNSGRDLRHDSFDILTFHIAPIAPRARFSEREEPLRVEMRGVSRK